MTKKIASIFLFLVVFNIANAEVEREILIFEHRFTPEILHVPSGQKIKLTIINSDSTVEEFESADLKREKIVPSNGAIKLSIGPLKPGRYEFIGEFHKETAKGYIIADLE